MIDRIGQSNPQANMQGNLSQANQRDKSVLGASAVSKTAEADKNQALDWKPCAT
jgi:hypothetical protein